MHNSDLYRVILEKDGDLRSLLWLDQGRDGSIYLGPGEPSDVRPRPVARLRGVSGKVKWHDLKDFFQERSHH
jgi:hypothetical protein